MPSTTLILPTPPNFHFWRTAYSHGWCDLLPFTHDVEKQELSRILLLDDGVIVSTRLSANGKSIRAKITSVKPTTSVQKKSILAQLRVCLRLDEDFSEFHRWARKHPEYKWIATSGSGRMLRSPTVFEDAVKMICTTNCSWAFTKIMITNLTHAFGDKFKETVFAFPTPEAIAGSTDKFLRKEIKAGYRSPALLELAERVASGKLDIESWRTSPVSTDELFEQMLDVRGIGPYAAGNIMKLVGRYDYLGLDSWVRGQYYRLHRNGRKVKDSTIEKHYAEYGKWRGLFFWLEMTRYWHDEKFTL